MALPSKLELDLSATAASLSPGPDTQPAESSLDARFTRHHACGAPIDTRSGHFTTQAGDYLRQQWKCGAQAAVLCAGTGHRDERFLHAFPVSLVSQAKPECEPRDRLWQADSLTHLLLR